MKNKFKGELSWIDPKLLVNENKYDKIESFFIGLGLVFNDLKGLILFEILLVDNYEKPKDNETTSHAGNYGGILVQIHKLMASTIHEFFKFLEKNLDILNESDFKEILSKLSNPDKRLWEGLFAAARGDLSNTTDFLKSIIKIRNNVGFHYDHSGKILRNGYISIFFGNVRDDRNKFAYYSIDETIELTRFYFSDAAAEESLKIASGKKPKEKSIGDEVFDKYKKQFVETINVLNFAIIKLLGKYIQFCRNHPR